jgi:aspartate carbamoyltransferase catalytic subunit
VSVLSAGEAHLSHPTQGLLDALTIRQYKGAIDQLCVAIVGDVRHSRVARSAYEVLKALGVRELRLVAPRGLMPESDEFPGCTRSGDLDAALEGADVVMMLRIQMERMTAAAIPDGEHFARYGSPCQSSGARPDATDASADEPRHRDRLRGADGPQSVIRAQVSNGARRHGGVAGGDAALAGPP